MANHDYNELKNLLINASNAYYKENNPIMSDYEFDTKLKELEEMEKKQGYSDPDSPTQKVGSDLESNKSRQHERPMLSLENTYSLEEVRKWYESMCKAANTDSLKVIVEPKWDGCSCAIRFMEDGSIMALTRGDGLVGEDITQNVKYLCDNIWNKWCGGLSRFVFEAYDQLVPFVGEVRGELVMTKEGFDILNKDGKYQNARNLLSGSMKLLDINEFAKRAPYIQFKAYWLEKGSNIEERYFKDYDDYEIDLIMLRDSGFNTWWTSPDSIDGIIKNINSIEKYNFDANIDGAVIKVADKKLWDTLGSTAKYPRWARAYKYKQESIETVVNNIEFWVGRTGKITPVAWFEPKFIDGSTVQKATLNNADFYKSMDIAIGDTISVQKAAAIIPQIISVNNRPEGRKVINFPKKCPICGTKLTKHNQEHADWYCDNEYCSARTIDRIINYTHALEIDGFAEVIVERLYNAGLLKSIGDLYNLKNHKDEISKLERLSSKIADKLCDNIEASKSNDFWKLLVGLGISNVGPKTAKMLAKQFKTMKVLQGSSYEDFILLDDIGDVVSNSIIQYFRNTENRLLISVLEKEGVNMKVENIEETEKPSMELYGKTVCITGALSLTRSVYIDLIESCGGKVVNSINKKTSYLITNDKTTGTSKNIKAQELGIPILNERELLELCDSLHLLKEIEGI